MARNLYRFTFRLGARGAFVTSHDLHEIRYFIRERLLLPSTWITVQILDSKGESHPIERLAGNDPQLKKMFEEPWDGTKGAEFEQKPDYQGGARLPIVVDSRAAGGRGDGPEPVLCPPSVPSARAQNGVCAEDGARRGPVPAPQAAERGDEAPFREPHARPEHEDLPEQPGEPGMMWDDFGHPEREPIEPADDRSAPRPARWPGFVGVAAVLLLAGAGIKTALSDSSGSEPESGVERRYRVVANLHLRQGPSRSAAKKGTVTRDRTLTGISQPDPSGEYWLYITKGKHAGYYVSAKYLELTNTTGDDDLPENE